MLCCAPDHLTSEHSLILTDKYHRPSANLSYLGNNPPRNLSPISSSFPCTQRFQADVSRKNHQKAFLGQISSGTLTQPQKIFSKFLWEGTMPWMTKFFSWAPRVPMVCFMCWNGLVARAVVFQHSQVFLHHFFPHSLF